MTEFHSDNQHFENLRREEQERARERRLAGNAEPEEIQYEEGKEPGHLGNDTSKMKLLETDLEAIAKGETDIPREKNPDVAQALKELQEIDTGPFPDEVQK